MKIRINNKILPTVAKGVLLLFLFLFTLNVSLYNNSATSAITTSAEAQSPSIVTQTLSGKDTTGAPVQNGQWVQGLYNFSKGFVNIIAILILFIVAFATILGIQIDTYGIKKLLPATLVAVVVANISLPIFAISSSIIDTIQDEVSFFAPYQFVNSFGFFFHNTNLTTSLGTIGTSVTITSLLFGGLAIAGGGLILALSGLLLIVPSMIIIALGFILSFRPYVIFLAGGIAPIAIMLSVLPQTQSLFKKWVGIASAWMIMPIVAFGIIHLADMIPTINYVPGAGGVVTAIVGFFLPIAIKAGLLLLAIRFPFMIEKDITNITRITGKAIGNAALYSGARAGNFLYKRQKAIDLNIGNRVREASEGFNGEDSNRENKERFFKLMRRRGLSAVEAKTKWDTSTADERRKTFQEETRNEILTERQYRAPWNRPSWLMTGAAITSMPLGIIEGVKLKKETAGKEVSKQAQKALMRGALSPEGNNASARILRSFFDPRAVRGFLGDLKYFEEIAENDLKGNLSPDQVAEHINARGLMRRMVNSMVGEDASEEDKLRAEKIIEGRMRQLYIAQESVGTWGDMDFIQNAGLNSAEIAKLKVGYGRIQEQALRQSAYGQGQIRREMGYRTAQEAMHGRPLESVPEFKERMLREGYSEDVINRNIEKRADYSTRGASGIDQPGNGLERAEKELAGARGLDDTLDPNNEVSAKLDSLIEAISSQTRSIGQGLNINAIRSGISLVDGANLQPTDIGAVDGKIGGLIATLSDRMRSMRFREQDIRKFASILESEDVFNLSEITSQFGSAGSDTQLKKILEDIQSAKVARIGLLSSTEQAQSVQRISAEIVPKLQQNPNLSQELQRACGQIIEVQLGINPRISPQDLSVAKNLIANTVSGFASTTEGGESTYDVSAQAALRILKAIESSSKGQ